MEFAERKSVNDKLRKYDHLAKEDDFIEVTEWANGERQLQNLGKWVQENQDNWNEKCLLILDEADKGFDLRYQVGLHNMLINIPAKSNVKFLVVSHTLIPILLEDKVYAFQYRRMLSPSTYIFVETGYDIKIDKDERTEV